MISKAQHFQRTEPGTATIDRLGRYGRWLWQRHLNKSRELADIRKRVVQPGTATSKVRLADTWNTRPGIRRAVQTDVEVPVGIGGALDLIDLDRYPIHDLDSPAGRKLVDACRHDLDSTALCVLPGFVHEDARVAMVAEATAVLPETVHIQRPRTAYGWMDNGGFPPDHPRSALHQQNQGNLYGDQIDEGLMKQLFALDELCEFVRRALGFDTLYVSADPGSGLDGRRHGRRGATGVALRYERRCRVAVATGARSRRPIRIRPVHP